MNYEIIDFHCHPFVAAEQNFCRYDKEIGVEDFAEDMTRAGIRTFCGSVVKQGVQSFDDIRKLNRDALHLRGVYGGRYIPGVHIHPDYVRESCEELQAMHARGVRLIGELVPYMMGWSAYTCPGAMEIFAYAQELDMVVNFHSGDDEDMARLYRSFPHMQFVAAHPREYEGYMKHLEHMEKYENVCLDLCGTGLFRYGMLRCGVSRVGASRFLFGTDYPICNPAMQVHGILYERLRDADYEAIFAGNAKRILRI